MAKVDIPTTSDLRPVLDAGDHEGVLRSIEHRISKRSGNPMLVFDFQFRDPGTGRAIFVTTYEVLKEYAGSNARKFLANLGLDPDNFDDEAWRADNPDGIKVGASVTKTVGQDAAGNARDENGINAVWRA